ncbi:MAG: ABC transporter permease [Acidimicrobiia bacterium]
MTAAALPVEGSDRPWPLSLALRLARALVVVAALVGTWQLVLSVFHVEPYHVPPPRVTFEALVDQRGFLFESLVTTFASTAAGLAVSAVVAFALASVFVASPTTERALLPIALFVRSLPIVAMAPLLTIVAGRGWRTSLFCVSVVTFFPMLVNAAQGLRSVKPEMRELFRVNAASRWQLLRQARLPIATPYMLTGIRVAVSVGVLGAMTAEWLTGSQGLGYLLQRAASRRQLGLLWAGVVVSTGAAVAIFAFTVAVERRVLRRYAPDRVQS